MSTTTYTSASVKVFPPRAEHRVTEDKIREFPVPTWVGQCKMNGTALVVICIGGRITIMNRHDKIYVTKIEEAEYKAIFPKCDNWILCGEYMNKAQDDETGKPLRDKFYIWDIINFNGEDLIGMTFIDRLDLLLKNTKRGKKSTRPYLLKELSENIAIVRTFETQLEEAFKLSWIPMIEGLVIKRRNAALKPCNRSDNNTDWQVKVRKGTKCYKF